jgi:hypothetical protein
MLNSKVHQDYYYNECHEGIIEIANSLLEILTNQATQCQSVSVSLPLSVTGIEVPT